MTAVVYTAKRSVIAGHSSGSSYSLDLRVAEGGLTISRKVGSEVQRTISDKTETLYYFGKTAWSVSVMPIGSSELAALQEFLHSVEAQETFTFSPYGTVSALGTTYSARLVQSNYTLERMDRTGSSPSEDAMRVTFDLEEA